jgi:hypothetical protein
MLEHLHIKVTAKTKYMTHKLIKTDDYLLVVDDSEIQKGDCYLSPSGIWFYNHLNPNHNKESKKVCAHLPLNGSPILEGVDLLPPIEDDVVELAESFCKGMSLTTSEYRNLKFGYAEGYIRARERYKYTEEDMRKAIAFGGTKVAMKESLNSSDAEEFIQSIHQYPTEFECEMESVRQPPPSRGFNVVPITVISAHGVEWVGKYK